MKTFNDLEIYSSTEKLQELLKKIKKYLPSNWLYKKDYIESYSKNTSKSIDEVLCVESPVIAGKKGLVWIGQWGDCIKVVNIVPTEPGSLLYDQYNLILDNFFKDCVSKFISDERVVYNTEGKNILSIAGEITLKKMELWETACNHSTGNTHPFDFERWSDFVITAHKQKSKLTPEWFEKWLVEEKGWNEDFDTTTRLVLEYEYSRNLLQEYDKY